MVLEFKGQLKTVVMRMFCKYIYIVYRLGIRSMFAFKVRLCVLMLEETSTWLYVSFIHEAWALQAQYSNCQIFLRFDAITKFLFYLTHTISVTGMDIMMW